jgi:hypothetical protein
MLLLHMEQTDDCRIRHAKNVCEYKQLELQHYSVDGYCAD